jgi:hypothetical protein
MFRQASLISVLALISCGKSDDTTDTSVTLTQEAHGKIAGVVTDASGLPLVGVLVSVQGISVSTNETGAFVVPDVQPSPRALVSFTKSGYAKNYSYVALESFETANTNATLLEVTGTRTIQSNVASEVEVEGTTISFTANSFLTSEGDAYSGEVRVEVTNLDPHSEDALGAPGDLSAISFTDSDTTKSATTPSQLVSYGMVDVTLFGEDDEVLNVSDSSPADVEIGISNGELPELYQLGDGDSQVAWSFIPEYGKWVEEGDGTVVERDGELFFQFQATHFSWWNCDQGFVPSCAAGRVVDVVDFPIRGAQVACRGEQTTSIVTTDDNGYYVCDIMVGDTVAFGASTFVGERIWRNGLSQFMDGEGTDATTCEPIPTIKIDVCRIAGSVNVQNVSAVTEEDTVAVNGDGITAVFWEPPGDPVFCENPWDAIDEGECWLGTTGDIQQSYPDSAIPGIPETAQSVGTWLEIYDNSTNAYRLNRNYQQGLPVYVNEDNEKPELEAGSELDISAAGDYDSYFGEWDISRFAVIPEAAGFEDNSGIQQLNGTQRIDIRNPSELTVARVMVEDSIAICRADEYGFTVDTSGLNSGFGGMDIMNVESELLAGPDGLPIRVQLFSGESLPVDVER